MTLTIPGPFPPLPPPGIVVAAQQEARDLFSSLEGWLSSAPALTLPIHLVEQQQQIRGRQVQRLLLQAHVQQRGTGDVGPALQVLHASSCSRFTHRRLQRRTLNTIFGPIHIDRIGYSHPGQPSIHPLDEALQLPARSFSYELQKRLAQAAVQGPWRESIDRILDISGLTVPMRSLAQILQDAAQDFDAFYAQRPADPSSPAASILVVAVDCKGIPIVKPPNSQRSVRRTKGQKANRKKMATVAAVFTRQPWIRTPEQVVESLFRVHSKTNDDQSPPPRPENKRIWASLVKGKAAVVDEVVAEVHRRDPDAHLTLVALTDGERALQIQVSKKLNVILILDLLHVTEKVWKAAHVLHPEGTPEAEIYARLMTHRILEGKVGQVVKGLRQTVTKRNLSGSRAKTLLSVAAYFHRNRDRMRYNDYLAQGLPIASGSVEGACKNLIKDRMERSGMRWTQLMAEAVVKLRALYLSGDFNTYWDFHIRKDQLRLYPPERWAVVVK
ncbi:MAG TPA: ISKra4 family transposase [Terracidiphilus sp.]